MNDMDAETSVDNNTVYVLGRPYKNGCFTQNGFIHLEQNGTLCGLRVKYV